MLKQRLSLGKYFGIRLYVHWTFSLLLAYAALQFYASGPVAMAFVVFIVMSLFVCITLHEYGHALAARRFGIPTVDITLLPIGGVARLERMPRVPWQELVVAVAGPAVNVVIATLLAVVLIFGMGVDIDIFASEDVAETSGAIVESSDVVKEGQEVTTPALAEETADQAAAEDDGNEIFENPSVLHFLMIMMVSNAVLVIFNMIPAFPMDGGRVLRSILAMFIDYRSATKLAAYIGLICAAGMVGMFFFWSEQKNPMMLLIAVFIGYAGMAEARQVDVMETVRGLRVCDAMIFSPPSISMDMTLQELSHQWRTLPVTALPVVSGVGTVVGLLKLSDVALAIQKGTALSTTAGQLAQHGLPNVLVDEKLEDVVMSLKRGQRQVPVVDDDHHLIGLLDIDLIRTRAPLAKLAQQLESQPTETESQEGDYFQR